MYSLKTLKRVIFRMCDTHAYTHTYTHRLLHPLKRDTEVVAVVSKNRGLVEVDKHHHLVDALACIIPYYPIMSPY